jgi:deferrochelatase/peroxidase EfeB
MASACLLEDERIVLSRRVIDAVHPSVMLDDNLGMARRKPAIGDETLPSDWVGGSPSKPVDALLIIASNDSAPVEAMADDLTQQAAATGARCRLPGVRCTAAERNRAFRIQGTEFLSRRSVGRRNIAWSFYLRLS